MPMALFSSLRPNEVYMYIFSDVCDKYASIYNVKINPEKSKLIVYSDKQKSDDTIDFNGVTISSVAYRVMYI